jgi:hypothetical protein
VRRAIAGFLRPAPALLPLAARDLLLAGDAAVAIVARSPASSVARACGRSRATWALKSAARDGSFANLRQIDCIAHAHIRALLANFFAGASVTPQPETHSSKTGGAVAQRLISLNQCDECGHQGGTQRRPEVWFDSCAQNHEV